MVPSTASLDAGVANAKIFFTFILRLKGKIYETCKNMCLQLNLGYGDGSIIFNRSLNSNKANKMTNASVAFYPQFRLLEALKLLYVRRKRDRFYSIRLPSVSALW